MASAGKVRKQSESPTEHWTDDLPICTQSGVGFSPNQRYRADGGRREEHEFEDQSFHFHFVDRDCYLYGVFDGYNGRTAAEFAAQKLPAELVFGQLTDGMNDDDIREVLKQAIMGVEKGFFDSIGDKLVEKTLIEEEIAGLNQYDAVQQFPVKVDRLRVIKQEIACGTTAVVALIYNNRLFVTNVGNSRAVLCTTDSNGRLHVQQLSADHAIGNENELIRLSNLGLDVENIRLGPKFRNHESTRCIGDYTVKGGYKEFDILSAAIDEPVIAEPESFGGIPIDESFYFLVLMSDGLYKSLEDSKTLNQDVNVEILGLVATELQAQSTINGVCQAVVDRICRYHHDSFMNQNKQCERRDDMTLLLRLFNAQLGGSTPSPVSPLTNFHPFSGPSNLGFHVPFPFPASTYASSPAFQPPFSSVSETSPSLLTVPPKTTLSFTNAPTTTGSGHESFSGEQSGLNGDPDQTDGVFVECYVDFSEYFKAIEIHGEDFVANTVQL